MNTNKLIELGYEESQSDDIEIFCEPCFKTFHDKIEATHESHNVEMCYDCYQEFNE